MTKENQNFALYAGDTKIISSCAVDGSGCPKDLTGATIKWSMAVPTSISASNVVKRTGGSGIEFVDASAGHFEITLDSADTASRIGSFDHDAEAKDSASRVAHLFRGKITVKGHVEVPD